ncbi:MAG: helix-turn-helix domain-containing protein [Armatimonadota bacterium]
MQDQNLLSMTEAAQRKGVPVADVQKAVEAGELPARYQSGAPFLRPEDVEAWVPHMKTAAGSDFTDEEAADYLRTPG